MRTHGWGGDTPASNDEASERILRATGELIDSGTTTPSILQVAKALGITRQTVYRYFAGTDELLRAVAEHAAQQLLHDLAAATRGISDVAEAVVEAIARTIEMLRANARFALLFTSGDAVTTVTSPRAIALGRAIVDGYDVDWSGWTEVERDELVEHMLRTVQSFLVDPGDPPRNGAELRRYLRRWTGSSVTARPTRA
ncbi:TetR/AcrR family transcriptional regulator [Gordonia paraffinivorans]|uniref:TetR/AcrR family transcriptional regulator n=1 Tax=Gordonia paraffinivorans TaxID=175628 RepID=UPI003FCD9864